MGFRFSLTAAALQAAYTPPQARPADVLQPLPAADVLSLEIAHADTLAEIAKGRATAQTLWDWTANVLTWSRAADLAGLGQEEMGFQLQLCLDLIARWRCRPPKQRVLLVASMAYERISGECTTLGSATYAPEESITWRCDVNTLEAWCGATGRPACRQSRPIGWSP